MSLKFVGTDKIYAAAHLPLLKESLSVIGGRLRVLVKEAHLPHFNRLLTWLNSLQATQGEVPPGAAGRLDVMHHFKFLETA